MVITKTYLNMTTLSNSELTVKVSPHGAELCSIVCNEKEYLWQADPAFWKRHSPVLFPLWAVFGRTNSVMKALPTH